MLLAPGHIQGLPQPKIHVRVSRIAQVISRASFAGVSVAEILVNRLDIATAAAEEFWCTGTAGTRWGSNPGGASVDRIYGSHVGLVVPVGCPAGVIERRANRQASVPAEDAGELPPSKDRLHRPVVGVHEDSALAKRHLPYRGSIDEVPDVEV